MFKKMKRWYHPEDISVKGTRLLHHHPGGNHVTIFRSYDFLKIAFKLLTQKAQLLGYTPQVSKKFLMIIIVIFIYNLAITSSATSAFWRSICWIDT